MINKVYTFNCCFQSENLQIVSKEILSELPKKLSKTVQEQNINKEQKNRKNYSEDDDSTLDSKNSEKITIYQKGNFRGKIFHVGRSTFFFESKQRQHQKSTNYGQLQEDTMISTVQNLQKNLSIFSQEIIEKSGNALNQKPSFIYLRPVDTQDSTLFQSNEDNSSIITQGQKEMDYLNKYLQRSSSERRYKEKQSTITRTYKLQKLQRVRQGAIIEGQNLFQVIINQVTKESISSIDSKDNSRESIASEISLLACIAK